MSNSLDVQIHPSSIVEKGAQLDSGVVVGPFCTLSSQTKIAKGTRLISHVVIEGDVAMGSDNLVYPFTVLGAAPQALKYNNEPTNVIIGNNNIIRECVTINRGMELGISKTVVGNHNLIMAYCHLAHDVVMGDHIVLANSAQIAGHVTFGNYVVLGGASQVTQFCRIGDHAYIGGATCVRKDVMPFSSGKGESFRPYGINTIGLERRGYTVEEIQFIKKIYKIYYLQDLPHKDAVEKLKELHAATDGERQKGFVAQVLNFLESSQMGLAR